MSALLHGEHPWIGREVEDTATGRRGILRAIAPELNIATPMAWLWPEGGGTESVSAVPWWGSGYSMRWTWRVTRFLDDRVFENVADTFHAWGVSWRLADLLGELAVDYAGDLRKVVSCRYVAVTATLDGFRATVSTIPAQAPAPVHGAPIPNRGRPYLGTSWGHARMEAGPCLYAGVNLLGVTPL